MKRILVIADDLTGAAEIGGIAHRYGLSTQLFLRSPGRFPAEATIIDTDTRLVPAAKTPATIQQFVANVNPREFDLIYKKTDSVMRGQVLTEISALMNILAFPDALLVPQNPSRGRTIVDGEYRIDGVPLHRTGFADDPDHPATTSDVLKMLGVTDRIPVSVLKPAHGVLGHGLMIGSAQTDAEVRHWANCLKAEVLPAGGADFFTAILESRNLRATRAPVTHLPGGRRIFVCGSASAPSRELVATAQQRGLALCAMPANVFWGADASTWAQEACQTVGKNASTLVAITQPLERDSNTSRRLQGILAQLVQRVLEAQRVDFLFLEGGATASAVCRYLGWDELGMLGELAVGVVMLRAQLGGQRIVVKPGSYAWPTTVF